MPGDPMLGGYFGHWGSRWGKLYFVSSIIATASRESSMAWAKALDADHVINHKEALTPQIKALGLAITHVASLHYAESYFETYIDVLVPFAKIAMIDAPKHWV